MYKITKLTPRIIHCFVTKEKIVKTVNRILQDSRFIITNEWDYYFIIAIENTWVNVKLVSAPPDAELLLNNGSIFYGYANWMKHLRVLFSNKNLDDISLYVDKYVSEMMYNYELDKSSVEKQIKEN